ncbi:hypothetical protein ACSFBM_31415 [Variovorax sp. GB1R11]|uniref:hypothetical protein n=1 Tax=Variovorax sp. GB1R11 TaxID=3443741 RepID=UPI003F46B323
MCQMIAANLGIGVLPLATCQSLLGPKKRVAVRLTDGWARRRLLSGVNPALPLTAAAQMLLQHLRGA